MIGRLTKQGGSVATFIAVGILLAVILAGTMYLVVKRGDQARNNQTIASETKTSAPVKTSSSTSEKTSNAKSSSASAASSSSNPIPTTGSQLEIGELVGLYLLAFAGTSYMLSIIRLSRSL